MWARRREASDPFWKRGYTCFLLCRHQYLHCRHYCNSLSKCAVRCVLFEPVRLELWQGQPAITPGRGSSWFQRIQCHGTLRRCFSSWPGCWGRRPGGGGFRSWSLQVVPFCMCLDTSWHRGHMVKICRENKWRFALFCNLIAFMRTLLLCLCHA